MGDHRCVFVCPLECKICAVSFCITVHSLHVICCAGVDSCTECHSVCKSLHRLYARCYRRTHAWEMGYCGSQLTVSGLDLLHCVCDKTETKGTLQHKARERGSCHCLLHSQAEHSSSRCPVHFCRLGKGQTKNNLYLSHSLRP